MMLQNYPPPSQIGDGASENVGGASTIDKVKNIRKKTNPEIYKIFWRTIIFLRENFSRDPNYKEVWQAIFDDVKKYIGEMSKGQMNGRGTFISSDGSKFTGEFIDGGRKIIGTVNLSDGGKYVGNMKDFEPSGQGKMFWSNGNNFVGEWKNGKEFNGKKYDKDGNIIEKFVNGVKQK